jgi:hypothetical protein
MKYRSFKFNTRYGRVICKICDSLGVKFIRTGRKLLKWSLGRCSWCGADCGFNSSISQKGKRCVSFSRNCEKEP